MCEADHGLRHVCGERVRELPNYRQMLIDVAVCVNAAQGAYDLRQEVERTGTRNLDVFYGVYNIQTHQVSMPVDPRAPYDPSAVNLAPAPTDPRQFHDLAVQMAQTLTRGPHAPGKAPLNSGDRAGRDRKAASRTDGLNLGADDHLGMEHHH